jgi:hypothetical protein
VSSSPPIDIPRGEYALKMAGAVGLAVLGAAACTAALGGSNKSVMDTVLALAIGSTLTFLPAIVPVGASHWGIAVLCSGVARSLLILGLAYTLSEGHNDGSPRAFFIGTLIGAVAVLIAESAFAISMLARWDRQRLLVKHSEPGTNACP